MLSELKLILYFLYCMSVHVPQKFKFVIECQQPIVLPQVGVWEDQSTVSNSTVVLFK